jgi:hypothetical protein
MLKEFFNEPKIISDTFDEKSLITQYYLHQNYPNPFNPSTVIKYDLLESEKVELRIYNVLGQEVRTLVNELQEKGNKRVTWNGLDNLNRKVSTGIYFYKITAGSWSEVKKMILMK